MLSGGELSRSLWSFDREGCGKIIPNFYFFLVLKRENYENIFKFWYQSETGGLSRGFWKESVLVLNKSLLFFFSKVVFPLLWWTVVFVLLQFPIYFSLGEFWVAKYLVTILLFFIYLFMLSPIFKYYLDYMMDFSLVTPEFLTRYNQSWMLKRDIKSSYVKNIKTITIEKNTLRYNIFDNGNLIFLSEWDRDNDGEIVLHYIQNPEQAKKKIVRIMKL